MKKPIINEFFDAILTSNNEIFDRLSEERAEEAENIRFLICTNAKGSIDFGKQFNKIESEAPFMLPLLESSKFFVISKHTAYQNAQTGGQSGVILDWSFSFDSNFSDKLLGFFSKKNIDQTSKNKILTFLRLKNELNLQNDILPMIIENTRLARENDLNDRPMHTIAAFKAVDAFDWNAFNKNNSEFDFKPIWEELIEEAKSDIDDYFENKEVLKQESKALFVKCFLLEMSRIWFTENQSDPLHCLRQLIDFCIFRLGKLPSFELNLAYQFFNKPSSLPFFGHIANKSEHTLTHINGMAWDLTHIRLLETMSTQSQYGSFFIPYFVTFDKKLASLIKDNPIRFILIDDKEQKVLIGRKNQLEFQVALNEAMSNAARTQMGTKESHERFISVLDNSSLTNISSLIENQICTFLNK